MRKKGKRFQKRDQENPATVGGGRYDFDPEDFDSPEPGIDHIRRAKRTKFIKATRASKGSNFNILYVAIPSLLIVIVGAILFFQNQSSANANAAAANAIREVSIQPTLAGGKVSIPVEEVRKNKLVAFDRGNSGPDHR